MCLQSELCLLTESRKSKIAHWPGPSRSSLLMFFVCLTVSAAKWNGSFFLSMMLNTVSRGMLVHLRHVSIVMLTWRLFQLKFLLKVALTNTVMHLNNGQLLEKQRRIKEAHRLTFAGNLRYKSTNFIQNCGWRTAVTGSQHFLPSSPSLSFFL